MPQNYISKNVLSAFAFKEPEKKNCSNDYYGDYEGLEDAKVACKADKNCTAVYDIRCDNHNKFYLCSKNASVLSSEISCLHEKFLVGRYF